MSRACKKCGAIVPYWVTIDGKKRNLTGRKYCLVCSPFGVHNTKQLERVKELSASGETKKVIKVCAGCGCEFCTDKQRFCGSCNFRKQRDKRLRKIYDIVGTACWHCGYDKGFEGRSILDFHHVHPELKSFGVSAREVCCYRWERVLEEAQKCVLLCCRCHREEQIGLISKERILELYENWKFFMEGYPYGIAD